MTNIEKPKNLELENNFSYTKDAYIVWDSLSVWITNWVDIAKNSVKWWKQTSWMLEAVKNDIQTLKEKKVMFLLWGTNDVFSGKTSSQIIKNIDEIAEIARQNNVKVVVWTIPPFTESNPKVQKSLKILNSTWDKLSQVISEVNNHIRGKYNFIDYHKMIVDPNNPKAIDSQYEARNWADWIHPFNAYGIMRQAQRDKFVEVVWWDEKINANDIPWWAETIAKSREELERLRDMEHNDFLKIPFENRLAFITKWSKTAEWIKNWTDRNLEFTFTFLGKFNRDLFFNTTAWQVLPNEVSKVISGGREYVRSWFSGEFFSWKKRLVIREWTQVEIAELRKSEDLEKMLKDLEPKLEKYSDPLEKQIAAEALKRNIDPEAVLEWFKEILKKFPETEIPQRLEKIFTQLERIIWLEGIDRNNIEDLKNYTKWDSLWNLKNFNQFKWVIDLENLEIREWDKWLLDFISAYESGGNYNAIYGNANQSKVDYTKLTLREVLAISREHWKNTGSSAIWRYQFITSTLRTCMKATWLTENDRFNPENQDKMWLYLLKTAWLDWFKEWKVSVASFQLNLSKIWAALPKDTSWKSYYHWDWLNSAWVSHAKFNWLLHELKESNA